MKLQFVKITADQFAVIEKDPRTFYQVYDNGSYTLKIGLYKDGVILKTWEELENLGLDLEKDYSTDPSEPNYILAPDSGAADKVLDGNGLSGQLVVPDLGKIGDNALANSSGFEGMTTPQAGLVDEGIVNIPGSVGSIGEGAFANTNTEQANLPPSVNLAPNAFAGTPAAGNNNIIMNGHPLQNISVDLDNNDSVSVTLEKGYVYQITALYNFKDDVTGESTIVSSNNKIVAFIPDCLLRAVDKGSAIISGTYITPSGVKKHAEINCNVVDNGSGIYVHIPGETYIENLVDPTLTTDGSYDEVVYCADCGRQLSRTKKIIPKLMTDYGIYDAENNLIYTWSELKAKGIIKIYSDGSMGILQKNNLSGQLVIGKDAVLINVAGCTKLTFVYVPDTATQIEMSAFSRDTGLASTGENDIRISLGTGLTRIERYAFANFNANYIHYRGTMAQWNRISLETYWNCDNNSGSEIKRVFHVVCTDGIIDV